MSTLPLKVKSLRIVFIGTRPLASYCLQYIIEKRRYVNIEIVGIIGIKKNTYAWWSGESIKELWQIAKDNDLPYIDQSALSKIEFDLLFCINWGTILRKDVLSTPYLGCINLHIAPLPEYRGCYSFSHAILNKEKQYGSTIHYMDADIDTGDIIDHIQFPILDFDTAYTLYIRSAEYSFVMFCKTFWRIIDGSIKRIPQDKYAERLGITAKYYNSRSLDVYNDKDYVINKFGNIDSHTCEFLKRAFYFPYKVQMPAWLSSI